MRYGPTWLIPALAYIDAHYTGPINVRALAAEARVHPVHFARVFRQTKHCTVAQYVNTLRVAYACALLQVRDRPLVQIAMDTGFADQAHFTRIFTGHMGCPPGAFRRVIQPSEPFSP
jgi:AraC family transcriptional regulator